MKKITKVRRRCCDMETKNQIANVYAVLKETHMHYCPSYHHVTLRMTIFLFRMTVTI